MQNDAQAVLGGSDAEKCSYEKGLRILKETSVKVIISSLRIIFFNDNDSFDFFVYIDIYRKFNNVVKFLII